MIRLSAILAVVAAFVPLAVTQAIASPIAISSYSYQNPTQWTLHWSADPAEGTTTRHRLTDGVVGPWSFANQVSVGFQHTTANSADPVPMVDLDLGGLQRVASVRVNYAIDFSSGIFAPQTSMSILGSTDGVTFSQLAFKNDFPTVAQSQAARTTGIQAVEFDLGPAGVPATHLRVDVRTWATFFFMSEISAEAVPEPFSAGLAVSGCLGLGLIARRRGSSQQRATAV